MMNVTVTEPQSAGFLTVFPCDTARPNASNLNYESGETVPNSVAVKLAADGSVCFFAQKSLHLIADLSAWYGGTGPDGFSELTPVRLLDTREAIGTTTRTRVPGGATQELQVTGASVPAGAKGVTLNVTVTQPAGAGFVTVYPCDQPRPIVSNLNFVGGETVPNHVTVKLPTNGRVCLFTTTTTHLIVDAAGYLTDEQELVFINELV